MNFNFPLLKPVRILLLPFSLLAGTYIYLRNRLYDKKILRSTTFNLPMIGVGNLAVGGTGKSPMVEYILRLLQDQFQVATLSRGYKRKTKGYVLADSNSSALEIGDEPMQFHLKFPDVAVAVGEERIVAIPQILHDKPATEVIVLDDVFQHRPIQAGLNILLTDYSNLYTRDWFMPTGDLRDERSSAKRAAVIVVTKCPADLDEEKKKAIIKELNPTKFQAVYFTTIQYGQPYHIIDKTPKVLDPSAETVLVTGIANPAPLKKYLQEIDQTYWMMTYSDHHIFSIDDLQDIKKKYETLNNAESVILTTEKDAVRLVKFGNELEALPVYVIPVQHHFLFNEAAEFNNRILTFIEEFKRHQQVSA